MNFVIATMKKAHRLLLNAIEKNDIAKASDLITSGTVDLGAHPRTGPVPLVQAAKLSRVEIMQLLLDHGANIDAIEEVNGCGSACYIAVMGNQSEAVRVLAERGANLNVGELPLLKIVSQFGFSEQIMISLLDNGAPIDDLTAADLFGLVAKSKSFAVLERLLARNANVGMLRDVADRSLCHHVLLVPDRGPVDERLFRAVVGIAGCDVNQVDRFGNPPLFYALQSHATAAMRILIELGADIDAQWRDDSSALFHVAHCTGHLHSCMSVLLALGANVRLTNQRGRSACHLAAYTRSSVGLSLLLAGGSDLDQPENSGATPRQIALDRNCEVPTPQDIDAARRLIEKTRLDFVRNRSFEICVALQSLRVDALQLCEILSHSFGALGSLIAFHQWWTIAIKVKHFK
jgi:ankyrin repeat protein